MNYVAIALAILKIISAWMSSRAAKEAGDAADAKLIAGALDHALAEVERARQARQTVRDAGRRDPDSVLRDDDGFQRRD